MELDTETLQKYSNRTGMAFEPVHESNNAVIILLPETTNMESVIDMNLPTAVIAGNIESVKNTALEIGYPEEAIIIYENMRYLTLSGAELFQGQGITLKNIIQIANYIHDNDIRPEIYVWQPNKQQVRQVTQQVEPQAKTQPQVTPKSAQQGTPQATVQGTEPATGVISERDKSTPRNTQKSKFDDNTPVGTVQLKHKVEENSYTARPKMHTIPLIELADKTRKSILILKTIPSSATGETAQAIAQSIGALHVDVTGTGNINYGASKIEALSTKKYAYSPNGESVEVAADHSDIILYEVDAQFMKPEVLDKIFSQSDVVFQAPANIENSKTSIDLWLEAGFRLDGIVVTQDHNQYVAEWPKYAMSLDQAIAMIKENL